VDTLLIERFVACKAVKPVMFTNMYRIIVEGPEEKRTTSET
jgi:hypothetical protein